MAQVFAVECVGPGEVRLVGDFDIDSVGRFDDAMAPVLAKRSARLVIDLSDLTFLASAGLTCLVRTHQAHPNVVLRGVSPSVLRLLEVTGMTPVFHLEDGSANGAA